MTHRITLERNTLRFAAAHFTVSAAGCEPLHGHNYDVFVELDGDLTPDSWVIDFGEAKQIVRDLCRELDHRFLLPLHCPALTVQRSDAQVTITGDGFRYVMPEKDVTFLEIDNSTAERLAEWFARRVSADLEERGARNVTRVSVGVEEMPGQAGWFELATDG